jgi:hypothetical protein
MTRVVSMASLREEQMARRSGILVWFQSLIILAFLVWISEDYNHNQYFQSWTFTHLAGLGFLLNGTGATFYAGILMGLFLKSPLPHKLGSWVRRNEQAVPDSVLRFYDEIAVMNSEP